MSWYRTGTVSVVRNSTTVTGSGTSFAANSRVGDGFKGPDGREYEVTNIASASVLSILPAYIGDTLTGGSYAITPIQGYNKDTADALRAVSQSFVDVTESAESAAESAAAAREDRITVGLAATQVGLDRTAAEQAAEAAGESEGIATQGANTASQAAISAEQFRQAAEQSAIDAARSAEEAENASGGPSNTDQLREGETNKYWTGARTLGTALAGLVLDSAAVIAATDTVLSGLGKLQAQISGHVGKRGIAQHPVSNNVEAGFMPPFPSLTDGKTYGFKNGAWIEVAAGGNAAIFGEMKTLSSRALVIGGVPFADGQLIEGADALYPGAVANIQSANPTVPVTTPALWLSDPSLRACWAYDPATKQLRVPDWNGKQAGSIGPLMFRPDGTLGFAPGKIRQDQIQNMVGDVGLGGGTLGLISSASTPTGTFKRGTPKTNWIGATSTAEAYNLGFDASGSARTGAETFPTHGIGVWGVVLFGAVSNAGAADAAVLATSYANQQAAINSLQAKGKRATVIYEVANAGGGTQTLGAWRVRPLSGLLPDAVNTLGASIVSGGVAVPAGRYKFGLSLSTYNISNFRVRIYDNVSASEKWMSINNANLGTASLSVTSVCFAGEFLLPSAGNLTVEVYSTATQGTSGMGLASSIPVATIPTDRFLQFELESI